MTIVLVAPDGQVLGALVPFAVPTPWWQDVRPVVDAVRLRHGADVTIIRLLEAGRDAGDPFTMGGPVTYLAELNGPPPDAIDAWSGQLVDDPHRARWAEVGGPARDLAWAAGELASHGREAAGRPQQLRTWNLSSIWRLPTSSGDVWLKAVPPFFAHEGRLIDALASPSVPTLVAYDEAGRMLIEHIEGEDRYGATGPDVLAMVDVLVELQSGWAGRTSELVDFGLPDWRPVPFIQAAADTVARTAGALAPATRGALDRLLGGAEQRFSDLASCGLPDTLVHGDFHTGNVRMVEGGRPVILDWGDAGIGNPLFDVTAFIDRLPPSEQDAARRRFVAGWTAAVPGSDVARGAELLEPLAALRQALIYRRFLDGIERSEHCYHEADVPHWLERAARLA